MSIQCSNFCDEIEDKIDFSKCILCQMCLPTISAKRKVPLVTPFDIGYTSLFKDLVNFIEYKPTSVPNHIYLLYKKYRDFAVISERKAEYHKVCRNKYHIEKLNQMKRKDLKKLNLITEGTSQQIVVANDENCNTSASSVQFVCLFCDSANSESSLLCGTSDLSTIYQHAKNIKDDRVVTKLGDEKVESSNIIYHEICLTRFFENDFTNSERTGDEAVTYETTYKSILNEVITKMHDTRRFSISPPIFKVSELTKWMKARLADVGYEDAYIHVSRLKDQLLQLEPELRSDIVSNEITFLFDKDVARIVELTLKNTPLTDEMILSKAIDILRNSFLEENEEVFDGNLKYNFIPENTVPKILLNVVCGLLEPKSSKNVFERDVKSISPAAKNIAQLIKFNSLKCRRKSSAELKRRHTIQKEQPLPLYTGLLLHTSTRQKKLVNEFCKQGLSVSYDRVLEVEGAISSKICEMYSEDEVVCPPNLSLNTFTTAAIDNIDHNPTSTSAAYSFHGTGISIIQHFNENRTTNDYLKLEKRHFDNGATHALPSRYTNVTPLVTQTSELPLSTVPWNSDFVSSNPLKFVQNWLNYEKAEQTSKNFISWSAYNSRLPNNESSKCKSDSTMLPLLKDDINSPAVVRHAMDIIIGIVTKVNPNQVVVITGDQPVFAIGKEIQWNYPSKYGEDKIVLMLGGLHIEMSFISVIGSWLKGSGWDEVLAKAGITTPLRALGMLKSAHVKRSRYCHEVSLVALNVLLREKFESEAVGTEIEYMKWIDEKCKNSAQFEYWVNVMKMEAILLQLVKCIRESMIEEYIKILEGMCPWYFATHHHNYERWLPIFIRTLKQLPIQHPSIYEQFKMGHFTSRKTNKRFSCMSDDQLHEQNNKSVKESKYILGLLDKESALQKWMVSAPEIARLLNEYHNQHIINDDLRHHEDIPSFQTRFDKHVKDLVAAFREFNPFECSNLTSIGNEKRIMNADSERIVMKSFSDGNAAYRTFIEERLVTCKVSIHATISETNPPIFKSLAKKTVNKQKTLLTDLRQDANTFGKMFIACESRKGDVDEFFTHENNKYPPSISEFGQLRSTSSPTDILECFSKYKKTKKATGGFNVVLDSDANNVTALIIEGDSLVHFNPTGSSKTVSQYSNNVICSYIASASSRFKRIDVVFGEITKDLLNPEDDDGANYKYLLDRSTTIPKSLTKFIKCADTKKQFSNILSEDLNAKFQNETIELFCTRDNLVLTNNNGCDLTNISPTSNTAADNRIILHVSHAVKCGHQRIMIRTGNVDVVVLAVYAFKYFLPYISELWVDFGDKKQRRLIPVHSWYENHKEKSDFLPLFHAMTGCKIVSFFLGIGKLTAWNTWIKFKDINEIFQFMVDHPKAELDDSQFEVVEKFLMKMYDSTNNYSSLHHCRRILFGIKNRNIENCPPTQNALRQHIKRATFQHYNWLQCLTKDPVPIDVLNFGWYEAGEGYNPVWITIPSSSENINLKACKCKSDCKSALCNCRQSTLYCTKLCSCEGKCFNRLMNNNC